MTRQRWAPTQATDCSISPQNSLVSFITTRFMDAPARGAVRSVARPTDGATIVHPEEDS
ncbi:hypothetical protein Bcav_0305 [Beutenbergia cavernae DSM 12333]|uniref:Uncharacterized protein n=1 Tax=Beutenbergia cavernae (strain ATCC BAA-8 / DSM 12333 / CCUG 43141 / JCM 11478 / NBRC 16432 / NCIMB 13614 / HKI 0122) TaxID=471853 RepID=C5BWB1_BEUC1|nr:hypothetical protein Bcav_0305 [Beutenbergia cavernae DSM 12333]